MNTTQNAETDTSGAEDKPVIETHGLCKTFNGTTACALHIPYIIVFYAAEFNMMSVSFNIDRKAGFMVAVTFCILIGCLAYLYLG